jgi:hypothetical protein
VCGEVRVVEAPGARSGQKTVAMYAGYVDSVHERWTGDNQVGARARRGLLAVGSGAVGRRCPPYLAVGPRAVVRRGCVVVSVRRRRVGLVGLLLFLGFLSRSRDSQ